MSEANPRPAAPSAAGATPPRKPNRSLMIAGIIGGVCLVGLFCCGGSALVIALVGFGGRGKEAKATGTPSNTGTASTTSGKDADKAPELTMVGKWRDNLDGIWEFKDGGSASYSSGKLYQKLRWKMVSTKGKVVFVDVYDDKGTRDNEPLEITIFDNDHINISQGDINDNYKRIK